MERWHAKLFTLFGTFLLPFFCTILPYKLSKCIDRRGGSGKTIVSYLMCFGGGIFFGTYLLHMGPEVQTLMNDSLEILLNPNVTENRAHCLSGTPLRRIDYPIADLFVGLGFFIVLFAEKLVLFFNKRRIDKKKACRRDSAMLPSILVNSVGGGDSAVQHNAATCHRVSIEEMCKECKIGLPCSGNDEQELKLLTRSDSNVVKLQEVVDIEDFASVYQGAGTCGPTSAASCPFTGTGECCVDPVTTTRPMLTQEKHIIVAMKVDAEKKKERHDSLSSDRHSLHGSHGGGGHHHATRSIILILALSLHRIFEGMSIGLQHTTQNVWHLFLAVMCHETVIGFSLGLQFIKSAFPIRRLLLTSFLCSIIMPIGVAVGTVMTEVKHDTKYLNIANGILQAIAMGTFIYVTFFEILQEEVDPEDTSLVKILCIFAGFAMMALLSIIPEEQVEMNRNVIEDGGLRDAVTSLVSNLTTVSV